jgi:hypothetical protein
MTTYPALRRQILLQKKKVDALEKDVLRWEAVAKGARENWLKESIEVGTLQAQLNAAVRLDEDLTGKHGPIVDLPIGRFVITYLDDLSKNWPKQPPVCRINVSPIGEGHVRNRILDFRPYGMSADTLSKEDIEIVLAAVPQITGGPEFLEYLHSWATPDTFVEMSPGYLYRRLTS